MKPFVEERLGGDPYSYFARVAWAEQERRVLCRALERAGLCPSELPPDAERVSASLWDERASMATVGARDERTIRALQSR